MAELPVSKTNPEWWQEMFDTDWIKIFAYKNRDTRREVDGLVKLLGLPPRSKILDVCCGDGRVSLALARQGYHVTGLDYSQSLLEQARKRALKAGVDTQWVQKDMREIDIIGRYDAAINIFTSFGYFLSEEDDLRALQSIHKSLKKEGKLILDLENLFFISRAAQICGGEPMYRPLSRYQGWVEEVTLFDPSTQRVTMNLKIWFPEKGLQKAGTASYRSYSKIEMQRLLAQAGFQIQNVYGDFRLSPYELDSERMILLCTKTL